MYRVATISVFDVMDSVQIHGRVRLWTGMVTDGNDVEFDCDAMIQGVGSGDGREWLKDALIGLIETL
jgi:hypothetical protein